MQEPITTAYELRFTSLFDPGRALCFPCDGSGQVNTTALPEEAFYNYMYATQSVGIEHHTPVVRPVLEIVTRELR